MKTSETFTEQIKNFRGGVLNNPYQGTDKKVLFVCSAGILRSATGARMYAHKYNTRNCGSHLDMALIPLSENLLWWADEVVFVNKENYQNAMRDFPEIMSKLHNVRVLNIPDCYMHMDPELKKAFEEQYEAV